jgi:NAD+ diphosphatase
MHLRPRPPNTFAGPHVARHSAARHDADALRQLLESGAAAVVPVWQSRLLVSRRHGLRLLAPADPLIEGAAFEDLLLLGEFAGRQVFACEVATPAPPPVGDGDEFIDLRTAGTLLPHEEAGLLAYATALVLWRRRHRHCGSCGAVTRPQQAGHVMACTNADCGAHSFPRIDPAIIVLVSGGERALLGRQASWPPGRYSTLAGFVEPGESLEDAVAREVFEESGVRVADATYHSSQPWPFPSSLMLGFHARAATTDILCADEELEDARWFTRAELASGEPRLPPPLSVSFRLIEDWFDAGSDTPLRTLLGADIAALSRW